MDRERECPEVREDGCEVRRCGARTAAVRRINHGYRVGGKFVHAISAPEGAEVVEVPEEKPVTESEPVPDDDEVEEVWASIGAIRVQIPREGCGLTHWRRSEDGAVQVFPPLPPGTELEVVCRPGGRRRRSEARETPAEGQDGAVPPAPETLPAPPEGEEV